MAQDQHFEDSCDDAVLKVIDVALEHGRHRDETHAILRGVSDRLAKLAAECENIPKHVKTTVVRRGEAA